MSTFDSHYLDELNNSLHLKIEVDHQSEEIIDITISGELACEYQSQIEIIRKFSIRKTVKQMLESTYFDIFQQEPLEFLPLLHGLLFRSLNDFKGRNLALPETSEMVCLCFGVSKKEVLNYISDEPHKSFNELVLKTKATSACNGCLKKVLELIGKSDVLDTAPQKEVIIAGMNSNDLLIYVDHKISTWLKKENHEALLEIKIVSIEAAHIFLSVKSLNYNSSQQTELVKKLNIYLNQQLRAQIFLHF